MDLNEIPNDQMVIKSAKFDGKVGGESQNSGSKDSEVARRRCRETEEKCLAMELEIRKKSMDLEGVKARVRVLESEKGAIEEEIEGLRKKKANLEGTRVDEKLGAGKLFSLDDWKMDGQLIIENKVLECEKRSALTEVEIWKQKCKELESRVLELEGKLGCQGVDGIPIERKEATQNDGYDAHVSSGLGSSSHSLGAGNGGIQIEGTPCIGSPQKRYVLNEDAQTRVQHGINVKRQLLFQNENSCNRKLAPSTPAEARSSSGVLINIVDSDDEYDIPAKHGFDATPGAGSDGTSGILDQADVSGCAGELPFIGTPKKKRDPKVFTSDDEHEVEEALPRKRNFKIYNSDNDSEDNDGIRPIKQPFNSGDAERESDDDNIPISQLKVKRGRVLKCPQADNADTLTHSRRRRLVKSEQGEKKGRPQENENSPGNLIIENVEDDNREEDYSDGDSGSLSSFIVDDDVEDVEDDESEEDGTDDFHAPEDSSDDNLDFKDIISRLQRRKNPNSKWDLQGDMLSAFAKDPELCMRAVCALFRQQTSAEKLCKESLVQNGRGFSKFDASRGTRLGEFLTGGDPNGDLVKSKEELRKHDPYGLEECCRLAKHYSKQLFEIYENGEDPFFPC